MPSLDPILRKSLENKIPVVRQLAEEASRAILNTLAVNRLEPFPGMTVEQRGLRNALRAKARQLGEGSQTTGFEPLVEELAYQQWHRMVFARFLAENHLLMHPSGVPVTLQECGELVQEEGEVDAWAVAAKYATLMLPGIFRLNDPESQVRLTPEGQHKLETALNKLDEPFFQADDGLGWMYQFWQKQKKEEINRSTRKIGGADIPPVTQLFTEDYMVSFLLENSLGAWWAARHPGSPLIKDWHYLRFKEDGAPAAGTFPGWPKQVAQVTMMDPCFGSGHILVAGFTMMVAMRMEEEELNATDAGDAVLRDNLFGLELDPRCTQIGAFALALLAWKKGGYRPLPVLNLACSGIPVQGGLDNWRILVEKDKRLLETFTRLYQLFENAPTLGSLINPNEIDQKFPLLAVNYEEYAPILEKAIYANTNHYDYSTQVFGESAMDTAIAARLLARRYTLVITNVPYLTRNKQDDVLRAFIDNNFPESKADLATVFIERCRDFTQFDGSYCLVTPQNWIFLGSYKQIRAKLLREQTFNHVSLLGSGSTATASWEKLRALTIITNRKYLPDNELTGLNVFYSTDDQKADWLCHGNILITKQKGLLDLPDYRIILGEMKHGKLLLEYADAYQGIATADKSRFVRTFWELPIISNQTGWYLFQTSFGETGNFLGRHNIVDFNNLVAWNNEYGAARIQGEAAWGKWGVSVNQMRNLPVTLFTGDKYDANAHVIIPKNSRHLLPIYCFCQSKEYSEEVRKIDQKIGVTTATLIKVPFDLDHWIKVSADKYPDGLPIPKSNDPTQWLFNGQAQFSTAPLQVIVAQLLGYKWPQQVTNSFQELIDDDGIVCLGPVAGERPMVERLRDALSLLYGSDWSPRLQSELLSATGAAGKSLEDWLHDDFFTSHCRVFQNRPFIWHIWDGRKDGFSALVNYHKLNTARLDKLIYTYLGDWIRFQRTRRDQGESGADGRLVAALELEKMLKLVKEGERPYDIYIRWKPLAQQPIGWDPDLNDGICLNIRPFVTAGVLRSKFTINWNKDRGANPDGSERLNDLHFTIAQKQEARRHAG